MSLEQKSPSQQLRVAGGRTANGSAVEESSAIAKEPTSMSTLRRVHSQIANRKNDALRSTLRTGRSVVDTLLEGGARQHIEPMDNRSLPMQLLVLDEDAAVLRAITEIAREMGFDVHAYKTADMAETVLERQGIDIVLMDLKSLKSGLETLGNLRNRMPRVPIVVMTAFATVNSAVDAMRRGASDYLAKPFGLEELTGTLRKVAQQREFDVESRRLREQLQSDPSLGGVFGTSTAIQRTLRMASKVAFATHPVLITGESGTGKEMLASAIHRGGQASTLPGNRPAEKNTTQPFPPAKHDPDIVLPPFLPVDCAAYTQTLLEMELFGYVRAEGTSEREEKLGALATQGGGTLFLDNISEMPLELQARLVRILQDKRMRPPGATASIPVTVRIIAASSTDLPTLVDNGLFRKDLYFRLNVVNLRIPALRERREDVPVLTEFFMQGFSRERGMSMSLSQEAARALGLYEWPGNVRELESVIERACAISTGPVIHLVDLPTQLQHVAVDHLPESLRFDARPNASGYTLPASGNVGREEIVSIAELERNAILMTLRKLNGDKLKAASLLGIGKTTLYRKLKEYGIEE